MKRPLLITDCDEVLLHMVRHFADWLDAAHAIRFTPNAHDWAMHRHDGTRVAEPEMWGFLDEFFPGEMTRQTLVAHARDALVALAEIADIVVLTNLRDHCREHRIAQLATHGIAHRVECNQGGKGDPVARLVAEFGNPVTVFVDDLPHHHESVAQATPHVHRLHMVADPHVAAQMGKAPAAHARIDDWREARAWIAARFAAGHPADIEHTGDTA